MTRGNLSIIHSLIEERGYDTLYTEYKTLPVRTFRKKYSVSDNTLRQIFGPKITKQKRIMIQIIKKEGDTRSIVELAEKIVL